MICKYIFIAFFSIVFFGFLINNYVLIISGKKIITVNQLKSDREIGLVLGASVKTNGLPSDILADRLITSIEAYDLGKIKKIIVSGDNSRKNYNEPQIMKNFLVSKGVSDKNIYMDYAGFDTYDSIYRAKEIFGAESLVIFTQEYHLYRAVYISNGLGIDGIGIISDKQEYLAITRFKIREFFSRIKAFLEVDIFKTKPKFLGEKIEIK